MPSFFQFQKEFTFDPLSNMHAFIVSASIFAWTGETKRFKSFARVSKDDLYKDFKRLKREFIQSVKVSGNFSVGYIEGCHPSLFVP